MSESSVGRSFRWLSVRSEPGPRRLEDCGMGFRYVLSSSSFCVVVFCGGAGIIIIREEKRQEEKIRSGQAGLLVPKAATTARESLKAPPFRHL